MVSFVLLIDILIMLIFTHSQKLGGSVKTEESPNTTESKIKRNNYLFNFNIIYLISTFF